MRFFLFIPLLFCLNISAQVTVNYEVYFDKNSEVLTADAKQRLKLIETESKKSNEEIVDSVLLMGFCDRDGGSEYNKSLSRRRIMSVYQFLSQHCNVTSSFKLEAYGNSVLKYDTLNDDNNRRVEIVLYISKKKPIPERKDPLGKNTNQERKKMVAANLSVAQKGEIVEMKGIQFFPGTSKPLESAYPVMDELVKVMKKNPKMTIEVMGHICCALDDSDNLSGQRALSVRRYLIDNGIEDSRVRAKGYGHSQPLTDESTPEKQQINRRVEIQILTK